jgi:hypothetical protein
MAAGRHFSFSHAKFPFIQIRVSGQHVVGRAAADGKGDGWLAELAEHLGIEDGALARRSTLRPFDDTRPSSGAGA